MVKKQANAVDVHIGMRLRIRRILIDMSQEQVADHLGVTFQQVQKYELGVNRITAARLVQLSAVLGVALDYFFEGAPDDTRVSNSGERASGRDLVPSGEGIELSLAFMRIRSVGVRARVLALANALSEETVSDFAGA